jgi:hypothetical protein
MSRFLWEKAHSKRCMLDYYLGVEQGLQEHIISKDFAEIRTTDSEMQKWWLHSSFSDKDLSKEAILSAAHVVLDTTSVAPDQLGRSFELLAASVSRDRSFKPAVRLDRFAVDDGPVKPDCVEVVIREVVESLIFDSHSKVLRADLLPTNANAALKSMYADVMDATIGGQWFRLCSELSGCDYLSKTSSGKQYELRPALTNVCKALGILLASEANWSSVKDLESFWKGHLANRSQRIDVGTETVETLTSVIECESSLLSFRAPHSDTEMIHREIGHIKLPKRNHEIILELESAHGLATVKHRRYQPDECVWEDPRIFELFSDHWRVHDQNSVSAYLDHGPRRLMLRMLFSAVLSEQLLHLANVKLSAADGTISPSVLGQSFLSARWGTLTECLQEVRVAKNGRFEIADGALTNDANHQEANALEQRATVALQLICKMLKATNCLESQMRKDTKKGCSECNMTAKELLLQWVLQRCWQPILTPSSVIDVIAWELVNLPDHIVMNPSLQKIVADLDSALKMGPNATTEAGTVGILNSLLSGSSELKFGADGRRRRPSSRHLLSLPLPIHQRWKLLRLLAKKWVFDLSLF